MRSDPKGSKCVPLTFSVCNVFGAVTSLRVVTGESMLRL